MLIIGCGNELRGDDAAGLLVARHLRSLGLNACEHTGDGLNLIQLWEPSSEVVLVDAVLAQGDPGQVRVWDGIAVPVEPDLFRCSSHSVGVAEAIEMARLLGNLPKQLLIYGIEGNQFEIGTTPSAAVLQAVEKVVHMILEGGTISESSRRKERI
jgi:hydrogenase maturation protease